MLLLIKKYYVVWKQILFFTFHRNVTNVVKSFSEIQILKSTWKKNTKLRKQGNASFSLTKRFVPSMTLVVSLRWWQWSWAGWHWKYRWWLHYWWKPMPCRLQLASKDDIMTHSRHLFTRHPHIFSWSLSNHRIIHNTFII